MFSMCSELTPRARNPDIRIPQLMQPCVNDVLGMLLNKLFDTSQSIGFRLIWAAGISQLSRWSRQTIVAFIDYLSGVDIVFVQLHTA